MCKKFMLIALKEAYKNVSKPKGGPFGACIVNGGKVVAKARNTVLKEDSTCHAEINAIRIASKKLKTYNLTGCVIYSTTEPCPMCFSAIHWAGIKDIYYGTNISDVKKLGFNELPLSNKKIIKMLGLQTNVQSSFLKKECEELLEKWAVNNKKNVY